MKILFVNHSNEKCGVYQYGKACYEVIEKIHEHLFDYAECETAQHFHQAVLSSQPDLILYNNHPSTLTYIDPEFILRYRQFLHVSLSHRLNQEKELSSCEQVFDFYIMSDPTLIEKSPRIFKIGRFLPKFDPIFKEPALPTIGSFGFGSRSKGFENLIDTVKAEFSEAVIRLNIPSPSLADPDNKWIENFKEKQAAKLQGTEIDLQITTDFLSKGELLQFLSENSLNAFLYPTRLKLVDSDGISSATDFALAVNRPLAISANPIFRHLHFIKPSIVAKIPTDRISLFRKSMQTRSLKQILEGGTDSYSFLRKIWSEEVFLQRFREILAAIKEQQDQIVLGNRRFNRVLNDEARQIYRSEIEWITKLSPEIIKRKIPRANVQQAFIFDSIRRHIRPWDRVLCVGSYEDTASDSLKKLGYQIEEIDPQINCDLESFFSKPETKPETYDLIFSTSVIEHVADDEGFIKRIVQLLKPGGKAFLTFDFKNDYTPGDPIFQCNFRFYTINDLYDRIIPLLENCTLVDTPVWYPPSHDFTLDNIQYAFGSLAFQKQTVAQRQSLNSEIVSQ
jgi:hypothetical protein